MSPLKLGFLTMTLKNVSKRKDLNFYLIQIKALTFGLKCIKTSYKWLKTQLK